MDILYLFKSRPVIVPAFLNISELLNQQNFEVAKENIKMQQQFESSTKPFGSSSSTKLPINSYVLNLLLNSTNSLTNNSASILNNNSILLTNSNSFVNNLTLTDNELFNNETEYEYNWSFCQEWLGVQNNLFQTANLFFAAAFVIPPTFKQSILLTRTLLVIGFIFTTFWGGMEVCAYDIFLWNMIITLVNFAHTVNLTIRFLPPVLNLELTELYLKMFKPLRVSKKHFKEMTKDAKIMVLEKGDIYAIEGISPADEKLSILLKGKLRVTCDDTHLHFIHQHQFIDSPEWESNHEQSDDVFQVTITAEEDCIYICWPRMKLERVLRHRPMLKIVLDCIIGKDITQKLYSLNEHLLNVSAETDRLKKKASTDIMCRSLSMDAVHTGTKGHLRSVSWRKEQRRPSLTTSGDNSPHNQKRYYAPIIANHFPPTFPFSHQHHHHQNRIIATSIPVNPSVPIVTSNQTTQGTNNELISTDGLLVPPNPITLPTAGVERKRSFRNSFRRNKETKTSQVKFQKQVKEVSYDALSQNIN